MENAVLGSSLSDAFVQWKSMRLNLSRSWFSTMDLWVLLRYLVGDSLKDSPGSYLLPFLTRTRSSNTLLVNRYPRDSNFLATIGWSAISFHSRRMICMAKWYWLIKVFCPKSAIRTCYIIRLPDVALIWLNRSNELQSVLYILFMSLFGQYYGNILGVSSIKFSSALLLPDAHQWWSDWSRGDRELPSQRPLHRVQRGRCGSYSEPSAKTLKECTALAGRKTFLRSGKKGDIFESQELVLSLCICHQLCFSNFKHCIFEA